MQGRHTYYTRNLREKMAQTHKTQTSLPYEAPFILSSVERDQCRMGVLTVPGVKRNHLHANLKTFSAEIGMDESEQKKFLDYWCSPSRFDDHVIRAELDQCFDLRQRAESWMERAKPAQRQPKSRLEQYAESAQQFYQNVQAKTIPNSPAGTQGFGYADIPDEQ